MKNSNGQKVMKTVNLLMNAAQIFVSTCCSMLICRWHFSNHRVKKAIIATDRTGDIEDITPERGYDAIASLYPEEQYTFYRILKRMVDLILSTVALVVLSPVMLVIAAAIKLDDNGPVFYKQQRLTKNGKIFNILKFRSMRVDAEKDGIARLSSGDNDIRITNVGRFIRKVHLDELPQLMNILKGDMSIVGPRPERPELFAEYERELPDFRQRLRVKAGLTGYAQVYGKYNATPRNKLAMDMFYIENQGIWEDIRIMLVTVKVLLMPDGAEAVCNQRRKKRKYENPDSYR